MERSISQDWQREHDYQKVYDYLHDFVGVSQKQKIMDDLSRFLLQQKVQWASKNNVLPSMESALICVAEPRTKEILELGGSLPNDLFLDNFGLILSAIMQAPITGVRGASVSVTNTAGVAKTVYGLDARASASVQPLFNGVAGVAIGAQIQIGSDATTPTRADSGITTAFGTAPESASFNCGNSSYTPGSGVLTVSGSVTSGGAGTIVEAAYIQECVDSAASSQKIAWTHDLTTSTPFTASKSITVQYSFAD